MPNYTSNLNLKKPIPLTENADIGILNDNMDLIDAVIGVINEKINTVENGAEVNLTATEILNLLLGVDGPGCGLDADKLDGLNSSDFLRATAKATDSDLFDGHDSSYFLVATSKAADSDKLDGLDSSQFLRSDADDSISENTTWVDGKGAIFGNGGDFYIYHDGTNNIIKSYKHGALTYLYGENASGANKLMAQFDPDSYARLYYAGSEKIRSDSFGAYVTGYIQTTSTTKCPNLNADLLDGAHLDTDTTLSGNSNTSVPSEHAVKTYVDKNGLKYASGYYAGTGVSRDITVGFTPKHVKCTDSHGSQSMVLDEIFGCKHVRTNESALKYESVPSYYTAATIITNGFHVVDLGNTSSRTCYWEAWG